MDKKQIENKIKELKAKIKNDEKMMEEDCESEFWWNDYEFNLSLLNRYEEKLLKLWEE